MQALWTASTGMAGQQTQIDVIANNLANLNTPGFKTARAQFQDLVYQNITTPGAPAPGGTVTPTGVSVGLGTRVASTPRMFAQGSLQQTQNQYDLAIQGDGFFQVTLPDGTIGYTRDGSFQVNGQGQLVTSDGYLVQPGITIPPTATAVTIGADGTVSVTMPGQQNPQQVGQLQLARFANPAGLLARGQNLFVATQASGAPLVATPGQQGTGTLAQGYVEQSNVSLVDQMVALIDAERAYEAMSKVVTTGDQMLQMANGMNG
ncbi:MAG TPA: flagellar basal-body rod protein FlgG [bacterium]|nr:flagellar basal-body rod protein FlgG [bacterium]